MGSVCSNSLFLIDVCYVLVLTFMLQLRSHSWTVISLSTSSPRTFTSLLLVAKMKTSSSCLRFFKAFSTLLLFFWGICSTFNDLILSLKQINVWCISFLWPGTMWRRWMLLRTWISSFCAWMKWSIRGNASLISYTYTSLKLVKDLVLSLSSVLNI